MVLHRQPSEDNMSQFKVPISWSKQEAHADVSHTTDKLYTKMRQSTKLFPLVYIWNVQMVWSR